MALPIGARPVTKGSRLSLQTHAGQGLPPCLLRAMQDRKEPASCAPCHSRRTWRPR